MQHGIERKLNGREGRAGTKDGTVERTGSARWGVSNCPGQARLKEGAKLHMELENMIVVGKYSYSIASRPLVSLDVCTSI